MPPHKNGASHLSTPAYGSINRSNCISHRPKKRSTDPIAYTTASASVANIVDRDDSVAGVVIDRESDRNAAAAFASMGLQAYQSELSGLRGELLFGALIEDAKVSIAIQMLAWTGRAAARVREGEFGEGVDGAGTAKETTAAVDTQSAGGQVRRGRGLDCGGIDPRREGYEKREYGGSRLEREHDYFFCSKDPDQYDRCVKV